ncbi:hypothetical protein H0H93_008374 [Arthromyces matolae]|nr:hypothetical protein H0H93_008374 [Arthromyces matolae]
MPFEKQASSRARNVLRVFSMASAEVGDQGLGAKLEFGQSDSLLAHLDDPELQKETSVIDNDENLVAEHEDDDDDENFVYPGLSTSVEDEEVQSTAVLEVNSSTTAEVIRGEVSRTPQPPSPAQLESLYAAASTGDLPLLKQLFHNALNNGDVESFGLANNESSRTGLTALHAAASRGYLEIVKWLIEECGAMPDLEDREGETALHKAALNGHLSIVEYLLPDRADVHARDADGWTALHNACSKCDMAILTLLPVNAASKGHLPVVLYLLWKQGADPLVRNKWGETAYDAAAAVFEVWICEMLQQAEAEKWRETTIPYNPLAVHTTVPLIVYENQRLDIRLKTLAISGGRPKFSASGLGKHGRRSPFELKLPTPDVETGVREIAAWRSDVQLPLRVTPWALPKPEPQDRAHNGAERSHFWLSDWTLDVTHPGVDAEDGWQYTHFFSDTEDQWTADVPPQLERLLSGSNLVGTGFGDSSGRRNSAGSSRPPQTWVRRRRWVRIMRRRLDIPPLPYLEPDGSMYHLDGDGSLIPFVEDQEGSGEGEGQEMGAMSSSFLSSAQDYVSRARYLVGNQTQYTDSNGAPSSAVEARRAIAKLERATTELRQGILVDEDNDRKTQAEVLLNAYNRELERRRLAAGAQGLLLAGNDDSIEQDDDDDDDDEFHYPGASISETPRSISRSSSSTDFFNRPSASRAPTDLTPQLSQAPDFRVPTREAPQKVILSRSTPTPHQLDPQWERDEAHCRKCGRIFCDRCSSHRLLLDPSEVVHDPAFPELQQSASLQRVCRVCFEETNAAVPSRLRRGRDASMERVFVDQARLTIPGQLTRRQSSSQLSDLAECPVCNRNLNEFASGEEQEFHVKTCLEGGADTPQSAKYLVYNLPAGSTLLGEECTVPFSSSQPGTDMDSFQV